MEQIWRLCWTRKQTLPPLAPEEMSTTLELLNSVNSILGAHSSLTTRIRAAQRKRRRELQDLPVPPADLLRVSPIPSPSPSAPSTRVSSPVLESKPDRPDLPPAKRARLARYTNYIPEEETIRNDYSQQYVDGGDWPQNWVLGAEPEKRFEEYANIPSYLHVYLSY